MTRMILVAPMLFVFYTLASGEPAFYADVATEAKPLIPNCTTEHMNTITQTRDLLRETMPSSLDLKTAWEGESIELLAHIGGNVNAMAISESYVFLGEGASLSVVDISSPATPQLVEQVLLPDWARDMAVEGDYAYVAAGSSGLRIFDIRNPLHPVAKAVYDSSPYIALKVIASDGLACLIASTITPPSITTVLYVLDVSDVNVATEQGVHYLYRDIVTSLAMKGDYAYVCTLSLSDLSHVLRVLDLTASGNIEEIVSIDLAGSAQAVLIQNQYLYVLSEDEESYLTIFDISNPESPTELGSHFVDGDPRDLMILDNVAYELIYDESESSTILNQVDISDVSAPELIRASVVPGEANRCIVRSEAAYVLGDDNFQILERDSQGFIPLASSNQTDILGLYPFLPSPDVIALAGNVGYIGVSDKVYGVDVTALASPKLFGPVFEVETFRRVSDIAIVGDRAFILSNRDLHVLDVSNTLSPTLVGTAADVGGNAISVVSDVAYIADSKGMTIVSAPHDSAPTVLGSVNTPAAPTAIVVVADQAYVTTGKWTDENDVEHNGSLHIFNVSFPAHPSLLSLYEIQGTANDVDVEGNMAYVACGSTTAENDQKELLIIDVRNPEKPTLLSSYNSLKAILNVEVAGDIAYVVEGMQQDNSVWSPLEKSLLAIDVSIPTNLSLAGYYECPLGKTSYVVSKGSQIFFANGQNGLQILRYTGQVNPGESGEGEGDQASSGPSCYGGAQSDSMGGDILLISISLMVLGLSGARVSRGKYL